MLKSLLIKNYALIKHLEIAPGDGFNVITGETGAGKSIMLGAVGLLMGNRADVKVLFNEDEKCVVEGHFEVSELNLSSFFEENELEFDKTCIVRREILPAGKSRAFINDTPVTLDILKLLGQRLVDVHSQHDTLQLANNSFQLNILDIVAENQDLLENYKNKYNDLKKAEKNLEQIKQNAASLKKEFEYNSFLFKELEEANLDNIDMPALEEELAILENAEEVKRKLSSAYEFLNNTEISAQSLIKETTQSLGSIASFSEKYKVLKERTVSVLIEVQDIVHDIEKEEGKIDTDEDKVILLKEKLNLVFRLQQKHGLKETKDLIDLRNNLEEKLFTVSNLDELISKTTKNIILLQEESNELAKKLSLSRKAASGPLQEKITALVRDLGMPDANFEIKITNKHLANDGGDDVIFNFSANKGSTPKPLKDVASGGEFARLMLALKYILAEKKKMPTIIFDEIDTGISGEVAIKVANLMQQMAQNLQLIVITHLHQMAGKGTHHYFVYKDNSSEKTISLIKQLNKEERIIEIAKMIGGHNPSENAINNAKELLSVK
jgi:DNA repair protein RecN (Recombination protein N)